MRTDLRLGQYYPAMSSLHRLDPRTKLFATLSVIASLYLCPYSTYYLAVLLGLLLAYRAAHIPLSLFWTSVRAISYLLFFTFVFRALITPGELLWQMGRISISREGLMEGTRLSLRLASMISAAALLSYTSTPKNLAEGLEQSLSFLARGGLPIHEMAVMTMLAFRFIPTLLGELLTLREAQAARGLDWEGASRWKRCCYVTKLLYPLFISVLRRSADLADAMEIRGYTGQNQAVTRLHPLRYTAADRWVYRLLGLGLLVLLGFRFFG